MRVLQKIKAPILTLLALGGFFSGVWFAQSTVWAGVSTRSIESNAISGLVPSGEKLKPVLFGFDILGADIYWIKTVLYTGGNVRSEDKHGLYPLVNLVTDLDKSFWRAYKQGILLLPDVDQKKETKMLLEKAEKNMPDRWEPLYAAGFYYYFYENDYDTAIEKYKKCTEFSGCLGGAKRMIRNLETRRGKYFIAIEQYLEQIQDPELSDDDYDLFRKKVEESAKLLLLNDAAQKFIQQKESSEISGENLEKLSDLEGFEFLPEQETLQVVHLIQSNASIFEFDFILKNSGKILIEKKTLIPAFEVNEMKWSEEENRVRTRVF